MGITGKGIWGPLEDRDAAIATLRRAIELGVHFIDTADSYGPYVSEELIAEAVAPYRPGVVVTTKGIGNVPVLVNGHTTLVPVTFAKHVRGA
jgi:aryl-alcohol dehydrogenase-like predicted oxidoreductase